MLDVLDKDDERMLYEKTALVEFRLYSTNHKATRIRHGEVLPSIKLLWILYVACAIGPIMEKYDVIHKTGSTHTASHSQRRQSKTGATATGNIHRIFGKVWGRVVSEISSWTDTETHRQTDMRITIPRCMLNKGRCQVYKPT